MGAIPRWRERVGAAWRAFYVRLEGWSLKWPLLGLTVVLLGEETWLGLLHKTVWPLLWPLIAQYVRELVAQQKANR